MKRIYVLFTALCVCCVLAAQDIKKLLILHTNDTHSRVEPIPITDPNPEFAGKAGVVRRVTLKMCIRDRLMIWLLMNCSISNPILMDSVISLQISCNILPSNPMKTHNRETLLNDNVLMTYRLLVTYIY